MTLEALRSHLKRQLEEDRSGRQSVERERSNIRVGSWGAAGPPLHHYAPLQAFAEAGEAATHPLPRSSTYVRDAAAFQERQPQSRLRDVGARQHRHHLGYLLARTP